MNVHAFVDGVNVVKQLVVVEEIHSRLVVQQYPRLGDRELPFFDLGKRVARLALTFRVACGGLFRRGLCLLLRLARVTRT